MLAATEPMFDALYVASIVSRTAHTVCGATLLGGLLYLRLVLAPAAKETVEPAVILFAGSRRAWSLCVASCSALLIVSGVYNLMLFTNKYADVPEPYHRIFGIKVLCSLGVMLIAACLAGRSKLAERMRTNMNGWLNVAIFLAMMVFLLGAALRSQREMPLPLVDTVMQQSVPPLNEK